MKAELGISELLYYNDCVIVPGLGGFVTKKAPARKLNNSNTILPPSKKIAFNARLSENDGLLVSFLSKKNNESYTDSFQRIKSFTDFVYEEMESGNKVSIANIGLLYFENDRNIQFEAYNKVNFLVQSYGLTPVHATQVALKSTDEIMEQEERHHEPVKPVFLSRAYQTRPSREKKKSKKWLAVFPLLAVIMALLYYNHNYKWISDNFFRPSVRADYTGYTDSFVEGHRQSYKEFNEKIKASLNLARVKAEKAKTDSIAEVNAEIAANSDVSKQTNEQGSSNEAIAVTTAPTQTVNKPAEKPKAEAVEKPVTKATVNEKPVTKYYVITGQFSVPENAVKMVAALKQNGFEAELAGERDGLKLVSCYATTDKQLADKKLTYIKSTMEKYAWIYAVKN